MARSQPNKNSNKSTTTEAPAQVAPEQEETSTMSTTTEEPTTTSATETPVEETPIDLSAFEAAVSAAFDAKNAETGEPGETDALVKAYRDLDGIKAKNAAKAKVIDLQDAAIDGDDIHGAKFYMKVSNLLVAAKSSGSKTPKEVTPVDHTEDFASHLAALDLARVLSPKPEGVEDDKVDERRTTLYNDNHAATVAYLAWLNGDKETRGDEPEASKLVKTAARFAKGSVTKSSGGGVRKVHSGPRKSPANHIKEVFAGVNSGDFLTVGQIVSAKSSEYDADEVSQGAISNALRAGKVEGVVADESAKPFGARKA